MHGPQAPAVATSHPERMSTSDPHAVPAALRPPVDVALAQAAETIPFPRSMPGGAVYEPKWDGWLH